MSYTLILRSANALSGDANAFSVDLPPSMLPRGNAWWCQLTGFSATLSSAGPVSIHCSFSEPGVSLFDTWTQGSSDCVGVCATNGGNYTPGPRILVRTPGQMERVSVTLRNTASLATLTTASASTVILSLTRATPEEQMF